ncbi:MAG: phospholipid/glycerol acyltransferase [Burkholderiales bacterium]|jgi:1-acyl-sn-glycerol-3-phosphate acyltransferase|nr:phospholipid/glycerol acyltransferase [Burkholderiales bacterium]
MPVKKPTLIVRARSTTLWTIMGVYTIIIFFAALLTAFCKPVTRNRVICTWTWLFNFCARNICGVKYQVIGAENIPNTPTIIASSHQSMWETLCFTQIFPQHVWVLKEELLKIPFFGWALSFAAPISINRNSSAKAMDKVLKQGRERFSQGFWILTFPEGTRLMPKERKKYKFGTAKLAILLNSQILPVAHNAGYCYPKTGLCLYPGLITVKVGKPIRPDNRGAEELTYQLEVRTNAMLDEIGS